MKIEKFFTGVFLKDAASLHLDTAHSMKTPIHRELG